MLLESQFSDIEDDLGENLLEGNFSDVEDDLGENLLEGNLEECLAGSLVDEDAGNR